MEICEHGGETMYPRQMHACPDAHGLRIETSSPFWPNAGTPSAKLDIHSEGVEPEEGRDWTAFEASKDYEVDWVPRD